MDEIKEWVKKKKKNHEAKILFLQEVCQIVDL